MIFGDSTFHSMIVADPKYRQIVFRVAIAAILRQPRVRSLRLLVPPHGIEVDTVLQLASSSFDLCHAPANHHSVLQLPSSYRNFLNTVGSRTRRNFRYYREHSEAAGHVYVEEIALAEFRKAAYSLLKEGVVGANVTGIDRAINIFATVNRPLLVGLRRENGEWLSLIGGWYESNRAVMFLQMNSDKRYARFSLSLVARAHLIESLIGKGVRSLVFWAGVGGPLSRYVEPVPATAIYVDAQHFAWRTFRRIVNSRRNWLPVALREWIGGPANGSSINAKPPAPPVQVLPRLEESNQ
jgi:hypothetical protein